MTNCQSWLVWINLRGHTIQRQATEDGNKSLVLFSMPFCIACPSTASCISVISVSGGTFYLASTWAESLSCRGCGCRCGGTMQSQYGLNTGEKKMTGRRHSPVTFLFLLPAMSKNPHFFPKTVLPVCLWAADAVLLLLTYIQLAMSAPPQKKISLS